MFNLFLIRRGSDFSGLKPWTRWETWIGVQSWYLQCRDLNLWANSSMYKVGYLNLLIELCTSALDFKRLKRIVIPRMFSCLATIRSSLSAGTGGTGCAKSFLNQRVRKCCLFKKYISKCLEYEIGVVRLAPVNPSVDIRRAPWRRVTMPSRSVMLVTCALAVQWSIKFWWKYFYSSCLVLSHQWSTVENISTMMILNEVPKIFRKWCASINSRLKH